MKAVIALLAVLKMVAAFGGNNGYVFYPAPQPVQPIVYQPAVLYRVVPVEKKTTTLPPTTTTTLPTTTAAEAGDSKTISCRGVMFLLPPAPQHMFYACCGQNVYHWPSQECQQETQPSEPEESPSAVQVSCGGASYTLSSVSLVVNYGCCGTSLIQLDGPKKSCNQAATPVVTTPAPTTPSTTTTLAPTTKKAVAATSCPPSCTCCTGHYPIFDPTRLYRCCPGYGPFNPTKVACPSK